MQKWIYKVCTIADWAEARKSGFYGGSNDDRRDGFIHFSTAGQLAGTLQRHFAAQAGLILLKIDSEGLKGDVRWEPARNGQLFPHLYGTLACADVIQETPLAMGADGRHLLPGDLD